MRARRNKPSAQRRRGNPLCLGGRRRSRGKSWRGQNPFWAPRAVPEGSRCDFRNLHKKCCRRVRSRAFGALCGPGFGHSNWAETLRAHWAEISCSLLKTLAGCSYNPIFCRMPTHHDCIKLRGTITIFPHTILNFPPCVSDGSALRPFS